jgi:hypothetical protein
MAIYLGEDSQSGECKEIVTSDEAYTNALLEFKADGTCIESRVEGGYTETSLRQSSI